MSGERPVAGAVTLFELLDLGSPDSTDWLLAAVCGQTDPEMFFPGRGQPNQAAKQVCAACPVQAECLENALARGDIYHGVRGGKSAQERQRLARQRKAAAKTGTEFRAVA